MPVPVDVQIPYVEHAGIEVDGRASEALWAEAPVFEDFHAYHPKPDAEVIGHARVRVLTDSEGIYFFFDVTDPEPDKVRVHFTRRDGVWRDDTVGVYLDPAGEGQRGYLFICNPLGLQADAVRVANQRDSFSWDGRWSSSGMRTDQGYQVEMAIPWDSVRHPAHAEKLGLSFLRATARTGQRSGWPRRDPDIQGILVQQALLGGPGPLPGNQGVLLMPELTVGYTEEGPVEGRWGIGGVSPGLTFRYDPSPAFATLGTINPDFSQVESDASQIDINQRYALYLREKRPFFTEGNEWFDTEFRNLLYTRSMAQPRAGARVTAEHNSWSAAGLSVLDSAPGASLSEGGGWSEENLEGKLALATMLRTRKAIGGDSAFGAFFSDRTILDSEMGSRMGGADLKFRLSDTWLLGGAALGSHTTLDDGSLLAGPAGTLGLSHESLNWKMALDGTYISPGFRAENGYLTYSDRAGLYGSVERMVYPALSAIPRVDLRLVEADLGMTSTGEWRDHVIGPSLGVAFQNSMELDVFVGHFSELYAGQRLMGTSHDVFVKGSPSETIKLGLGYGGGDGIYYDEEDPQLGRMVEAGGILAWSPGLRWVLRQALSWEQLDLGDELAYRGYVYRVSTETYMSQSAWIRVVLDRSSFSEESTAEVLLAWEKAPGQAAYLGGSIGSEGVWTALADPTEWQAFAKLAWTFGL